MLAHWLIFLLVLFAFSVRISESVACACHFESCPIAGEQGTCCDGYLCVNGGVNFNSCLPDGSYNNVGSCKSSPNEYGCLRNSDCCNPFSTCNAAQFCIIACPGRDPTPKPTFVPSTAVPTSSAAPTTAAPSASPSTAPSALPSTSVPTTRAPSKLPSALPSVRPSTAVPSARPTASPSTRVPTPTPSATPSAKPSPAPTVLTKFLVFSAEVQVDDVELDAKGGVDTAGIVAMQTALAKILNIAPKTYTSTDGGESVVTGVFFISQYDSAATTTTTTDVATALVTRTQKKEISTYSTTSTIKGTVLMVYKIIVAESQYSTTGSSLFDYLTSVLKTAASNGMLTTTVRGYADQYKSESLVSATVPQVSPDANFVEKDLDKPVDNSGDNSGENTISTANLSILIVFLFVLVLVVVSVSVYYCYVVKGKESVPHAVPMDLEEQGTEVKINGGEEATSLIKSGKAGEGGAVVHEPVFVFRNAVEETGQEGGVLDLTDVSRVMRAKALVADNIEQQAALMAFGTSGNNTSNSSLPRSEISPSPPPVNRHQKSFRLDNVHGSSEVDDDDFGSFGVVPFGDSKSVSFQVFTSRSSGGHLETLDDRLHRIESLLGSDNPAAPSFKSNESMDIHMIQEEGSMSEDRSIDDDQECVNNEVLRDVEDSTFL